MLQSLSSKASSNRSCLSSRLPGAPPPSASPPRTHPHGSSRAGPPSPYSTTSPSRTSASSPPPQRESRKLRQPVYLAQIDLARIYDLPLKRVTARDLSRFQAVERDFSFVMPDSVQWHAIASAVDALAIPELQSRQPVEIWRDAKKFPGVYSLLLRTCSNRTIAPCAMKRSPPGRHASSKPSQSLGGTQRA